MDNRQVAVVAVLVAVVALFVLALGVRITTGEGDAAAASADRNGLLNSIGGDAASVRPNELTGCQIDGDTITMQNGCVLRVAPRDSRLRLLRLRAVDSITVIAPAPDDADFEIRKRLAADDDVAVAVDRDGADVVLDCGFGRTCTVLLGGGR